MRANLEAGILPVRIEKWGSTEVRIATVTPDLTKNNSREPWNIPNPEYPESDYRKQTEPSIEPPMDVSLVKGAGGVPMRQKIEYRPQSSRQRAVGLST